MVSYLIANSGHYLAAHLASLKSSSCKVVDHETFRASRFFQNNDHLVIKSHPVPPLVERGPHPFGRRIPGIVHRRSHLDAPPVGPALELPDPDLLAAAAHADGLAAGRDLGVADARRVAPEPYPGRDRQGRRVGLAQVQNQGVIGEGRQEVRMGVADAHGAVFSGCGAWISSSAFCAAGPRRILRGGGRGSRLERHRVRQPSHGHVGGRRLGARDGWLQVEVLYPERPPLQRREGVGDRGDRAACGLSYRQGERGARCVRFERC